MNEPISEDERAQAAKDKLDKAIKEYYASMQPGVYINGWVVIVHKMSTDLMQQDMSEVSRLVPTGQPWPLTVGMLDITARAEVGHV